MERKGAAWPRNAAAAAMLHVVLAVHGASGSPFDPLPPGYFLASHAQVQINGQSRNMLQIPTLGPPPEVSTTTRLAFLKAVRKGNLESVKNLVERFPEADIPNLTSPQGTPAIWSAAYQGHKNIVEFLIDAGADVNSRNRNMTSAAYAAAQQGHGDVLRLLIDHGAELDEAGKWGSTPLLVASQAGQMDAVELLLDKGAKIDTRKSKSQQTALWSAAYRGFTGVVEALVERGAEVDVKDASGATPLFAAAQEGHDQVVDALLAAGADPNAADYEDNCPLHAAAALCRVDAVKRLLEGGADPTMEDGQGRRPGNSEVVCLGKPGNHRDHIQIQLLLMPLFAAVSDGDAVRAKKLLAGGEKVNLQLGNGWTALHLAAALGNLDVVEVLVESGANVNVEDKTGQKPVDVVGTAHSVGKQDRERILDALNNPEMVQSSVRLYGERKVKKSGSISLVGILMLAFGMPLALCAAAAFFMVRRRRDTREIKCAESWTIHSNDLAEDIVDWENVLPRMTSNPIHDLAPDFRPVQRQPPTELEEDSLQPQSPKQLPSSNGDSDSSGREKLGMIPEGEESGDRSRTTGGGPERQSRIPSSAGFRESTRSPNRMQRREVEPQPLEGLPPVSPVSSTTYESLEDTQPSKSDASTGLTRYSSTMLRTATGSSGTSMSFHDAESKTSLSGTSTTSGMWFSMSESPMLSQGRVPTPGSSAKTAEHPFSPSWVKRVEVNEHGKERKSPFSHLPASPGDGDGSVPTLRSHPVPIEENISEESSSRASDEMRVEDYLAKYSAFAKVAHLPMPGEEAEAKTDSSDAPKVRVVYVRQKSVSDIVDGFEKLSSKSASLPANSSTSRSRSDSSERTDEEMYETGRTGRGRSMREESMPEIPEILPEPVPEPVTEIVPERKMEADDIRLPPPPDGHSLVGMKVLNARKGAKLSGLPSTGPVSLDSGVWVRRTKSAGEVSTSSHDSGGPALTQKEASVSKASAGFWTLIKRMVKPGRFQPPTIEVPESPPKDDPKSGPLKVELRPIHVLLNSAPIDISKLKGSGEGAFKRGHKKSLSSPDKLQDFDPSASADMTVDEGPSRRQRGGVRLPRGPKDAIPFGSVDFDQEGNPVLNFPSVAMEVQAAGDGPSLLSNRNMGGVGKEGPSGSR